MSTDTTTEPNFDVDVDAPEAVEAEDTVEAPKAADEKPAKEPKNTRPAVPEGKVSPVAFAKILTEHLRQPHETLGTRLNENQAVAPQVVYSYIKNNAEGSKNPFPAQKSEGRAAVVDPQAGLEWWDAKDLRVKAQKDGKAAKDAAKAAKASEKPAEGETQAAPAAITEAE